MRWTLNNLTYLSLLPMPYFCDRNIIIIYVNYGEYRPTLYYNKLYSIGVSLSFLQCLCIHVSYCLMAKNTVWITIFLFQTWFWLLTKWTFWNSNHTAGHAFLILWFHPFPPSLSLTHCHPLTFPLWYKDPLIQDPITWIAPRPLPYPSVSARSANGRLSRCHRSNSASTNNPSPECCCQRRTNFNWILLIVLTMATFCHVIRFLFL